MGHPTSFFNPKQENEKAITRYLAFLSTDGFFINRFMDTTPVFYSAFQTIFYMLKDNILLTQ
ncbi:MAG: hypothetical protein C0403_10465 [Desulfobacterium sp.]|nr:hypothetical protein [Desulfobacterium sp.]